MNVRTLATRFVLTLPLALGACAADGEGPLGAAQVAANAPSPGDGSRGAAPATQASAAAAQGAEACTESPTWVSCPAHTTLVNLRPVHWQVPAGTPPEGGWPTVLMFQGSFFSASLSWAAADWFPFGAYYQTLVIKRLLDNGFAVIAPEARGAGLTFWDTNVPGLATNWQLAGDHRLMLAIFEAIDGGAFGDLRGARMYATGISSGGYMASRMAVSYPERFAAIGVQSGSYATCAGPLCLVPDLSPSHPPALLLHGRVDATVPFWTAEAYRDKLAAAGVENKLVADDGAGHEWVAAAPDEVLAWFVNHP